MYALSPSISSYKAFLLNLSISPALDFIVLLIVPQLVPRRHLVQNIRQQVILTVYLLFTKDPRGRNVCMLVKDGVEVEACGEGEGKGDEWCAGCAVGRRQKFRGEGGRMRDGRVVEGESRGEFVIV